MAFTILIRVRLLGCFITLTDLPLSFATFLNTRDVSRYVIYVLIMLLYLALGMVVNIISMMMLTLPILFPTVVDLGFDPVWFGVIMVIMMEMGQITPSVGINVSSTASRGSTTCPRPRSTAASFRLSSSRSS